ncbi:MAG: hypothetical protein LBM98_11695 [Oscillospiraceae bacterium]|nr:hypothetical protein [Oscillospiraceae bacterium]
MLRALTSYVSQVRRRSQRRRTAPGRRGRTRGLRNPGEASLAPTQRVQPATRPRNPRPNPRL